MIDSLMETKALIFMIAVVVSGIFLLRIVVRIFIKVILLIILLGIASYVLFFYNGGIV